jgi:hypothetical protein
MRNPLSKIIAMRSLLLTAAAVSGVALLTVAPASARTICRGDGQCFNTSGSPVYDQPQYHRYVYENPNRYRRHWHYHQDD